MRAHSLLSVLLLHFRTMWRHQKVTESGYCTVLWVIWLFSVLNWLKLQLDLILKIFGRGQRKKGIKRYRFLRYIFPTRLSLILFYSFKKNLRPLWKQTSEDQKKLLHVSYDVTLFQKLFFYTPKALTDLSRLHIARQIYLNDPRTLETADNFLFSITLNIFWVKCISITKIKVYVVGAPRDLIINAARALNLKNLALPLYWIHVLSTPIYHSGM